MTLNGNGIYRFTTVFLSGVLVTVLGAWATTARGVVTREEFPGLLNQYLPDRETFRTQNQALIVKDAETTLRLQALEIEFARLLARVDDLEVERPTRKANTKREKP